MSLFCFCVVDDYIEESKVQFYAIQIEKIAKKNNIGIKFHVDWIEPILSHIKKDALFINLVDSPGSDNCELLFLPDGWYFNAQTNEKTFKERMRFLQEISDILIKDKHCVNLYLGQSGTLLEEFIFVELKKNELVDYLTKNIGLYGVDEALHITIVP